MVPEPGEGWKILGRAGGNKAVALWSVWDSGGACGWAGGGGRGGLERAGDGAVRGMDGLGGGGNGGRDGRSGLQTVADTGLERIPAAVLSLPLTEDEDEIERESERMKTRIQGREMCNE